MSVIDGVKNLEAKWMACVGFDMVLKDAVPRYISTRPFTFGGNVYEAIVLRHSPLTVEGVNLYGVDAVMQIMLELNNADTNLNALIPPSNWQGGTIQPRLVFVNARTAAVTTDSIVYPKFIIDLPSETFPRVIFQAHNKFNMARKTLPLSRITKHDRYPFPDTAAERTAAGSDPSSEFFANGYDPATGKGNWKNPPTNTIPYQRADYNGLRDSEGPGTQVSLKTIGLSVRFGGFGKLPATVSYTPKKGQRADFPGNANESKYGKPVPLPFGTVRMTPHVLDTGSLEHWNGARLSHLLLADGVNFGPEATMGIEDVLDVYLMGVKGESTGYSVPKTSSQAHITGSWSPTTGYFGMQWGTDTSSHYRNINLATDFPDVAGKPADFKDRDPYSGLSVLNLGIPKEFAGDPSGIGPRTEVVLKGLKIETWGTGPGFSVTWQWTDNPIWIYIHLLKLLGWSVSSDIDKQWAYDSATYCDGVLSNGKKRFRCNLLISEITNTDDILRGIRNNCRMYTSWGEDGKLQLKIKRTFAGEGGAAFTITSANIARDSSGTVVAKQFHKSIQQTANVFTVHFLDEDNKYIHASRDKTHIGNANQTGEEIPGDSIFPILGIPSFDQAERQLEWTAGEHIDLNEFYRVRATLDLIKVKVGQVGTYTEPRLGRSAQQVRCITVTPGNLPETVELILQKHTDAPYGDTVGSTPLTRALNDSTYTPRSVGAKAGTSSTTGNPTLTELFVPDDISPEVYKRKIRVEFKPPPIVYEPGFDRATKISNLAVQTTGGSIPGNQQLFVEVCPRKSGVDGLSSNYMLANIPAGTNTNKFTFDLELPTEATDYVVRVGTFLGRLFEYSAAASPGTAKFSVTVSSVSAINATSLSPDPAYDHALILYRFGTQSLKLAGQTKDYTETQFDFEPEIPEGTETQITVIVLSANADENDFYPVGIAPSTTLTITTDTGNPSGGSGLVLLTSDDDLDIPAGDLVFQWSRDTVNVHGVYAAMCVLSPSLPAQGPYSAERAAHPGATIESGTGAVVTAGEKRVVLTRAASALAEGRVLLIWTPDGTPDSDLDGNVIESQGTDYVELTSPFSKGGTYSWAIVKRWWDLATASETTNVFAKTFQFGEGLMDDFSEVNEPLYRTKGVRYPNGSWYGTAYARNRFGVGARLTSALKDLTIGWHSSGDFKTAEGGRRIDISAANGIRGYSSDGTLRVVVFPTSAVGVEVNQIGRVNWASGEPLINLFNTGIQLINNESSASYVTVNKNASAPVININAATGQRTRIGINDDPYIQIQGDDVEIWKDICFHNALVNHGMTSIRDTDVFFALDIIGASGGMYLAGLTEDVIGLHLTAAATNDNTTKTTSGLAPIVLNASKKSGTTVGATGTDANLVVIQDNLSSVFIFDKEGEGHSRVVWSIYDEFNDVELLSDLQTALVAEHRGVKRAFVNFIKYNRDALEKAGLVHFNEEDPGYAFVNWTRVAMATTGGLIQLETRLRALEQGWWKRKLRRARELLRRRN